MNIRKRLKRQIDVKRKEGIDESESKKQFNMTIDKKLITSVHALAKAFRVPRFALTEHALDIGLHHLLRVIEDDKKRAAVEQHLITRHLLDIPGGDEEIIIRIAEGDHAWQLLVFARRVIGDLKALEHEIGIARRARDDSQMKKQRNKLDNSLLEMADWIYKHGLDSLGNPPDNPDNS